MRTALAAVPYRVYNLTWSDDLNLPGRPVAANVPAAQDPYTKIVGPRFTNEPYGLAISKQHPDFVRFVNAMLAKRRSDGQCAASYKRWVCSTVPPPPLARYRD